MKPWEEEWEYRSDGDDGVQIHTRPSPASDWELVLEHGWQSSDVDIKVVEARGRLAAAAPALARALLHLKSFLKENERDVAEKALKKAGVRWKA